jgi:hypothetical protein
VLHLTVSLVFSFVNFADVVLQQKRSNVDDEGVSIAGDLTSVGAGRRSLIGKKFV